MPPISLPDWPWSTVRRLAEERGVQVWPVGGAVRDALLDRPVHDWDFAVDGGEDGAMALARAVADALDGDYFPLDTDRDVGRAIARTAGGPRVELDFAALRQGDLEQDLRNRDFTINAMALDQDGDLVDVTGGQEDLAAGRIQVVDETAFRDDPARLLRAVRLEAQLGFEITDQTATWLRRDGPLLVRSSMERVRDEFVRLIQLPRAVLPIQRLDTFGLLALILPEVTALKGTPQTAPHRFDVWHHTLVVLDTLEAVVAVATGGKPGHPALADAPTMAWGDLARVTGQFAADIRDHLAVEVSGGRTRAPLLRLAALFHDAGKPQTLSQDDDGGIHFYNHELVGAQLAEDRMRGLHFSRGETARMRTLVGQHMRLGHLARTPQVTRRAVYRFFRATSCGGVDVILLGLADHLATHGPALDDGRWTRRLEVAEILLNHWFERYHETVEPPPLLSGNDVMAELGLKPSPRIGRLLEAVREAQAAGEVSSREEALALIRKKSRTPAARGNKKSFPGTNQE